MRTSQNTYVPTSGEYGQIIAQRLRHDRHPRKGVLRDARSFTHPVATAKRNGQAVLSICHPDLVAGLRKLLWAQAVRHEGKGSFNRAASIQKVVPRIVEGRAARGGACTCASGRARSRRRSAPAEVPAFALLHGQRVVYASGDYIEVVVSRGCVGKRLALPAALLRKTGGRKGVRAIGVYHIHKELSFEPASDHVLRLEGNMEGIRRGGEHVRLLVAVALEGIYQSGIGAITGGLRSSRLRVFKRLPGRPQYERRTRDDQQHQDRPQDAYHPMLLP
jgi:hypothetical protein